jgi:hypothetical protein
MDLDWCTQDCKDESILFNDNSVISLNNVEKSQPVAVNKNPVNTAKVKKELVIQECFNLDLENITKNNLLEILNYLSYVSNNLRTIIRHNSLINGFDRDGYNNLMNYLKWLQMACDKVKLFFINIKRKEMVNDNIFKPFKTSSYKFCNYKNSCSIHKNKSRVCDKNHFVFDIVLNDIEKLILSLELITKNNLDYINWIFSEKSIKITMESDQYEQHNLDSMIIEKVEFNLNNDNLNQNIYFIDKNIIFKCFDVISYVLNKMFEESTTFLTYNIQSLLINI